MILFKETRRIISKSNVLHFTRFAIIECKWFSIYIHRIYQPDTDRFLHDHPWNFFNIILKGGYQEELISDLRDRKIGSWSFNNAYIFHKIKKVYKTTTTLVITGQRFREWGYLTNTGWVEGKYYREHKGDWVILDITKKDGL